MAQNNEHKQAAVYLLDESAFKKSSDLSFVQRQRHFNLSAYFIQSSSSITISTYTDEYTEQQYSSLNVSLTSSKENQHDLKLYILIYDNQIIRLIFDDNNHDHNRNFDQQKKRFKSNGVLDPTLKPPIVLHTDLLQSDHQNPHHAAVLSLPSSLKLYIHFSPFHLHLTNDNHDRLVSINQDSRLNYDHFQSLDHEVFKTFEDTLPRGAESVGIDISFPLANQLHGIPERTVQFSLPDTITQLNDDANSEDNNVQILSEPYRMYNIDMPFYDVNKPIGLYGSIPFLYARNNNTTTTTINSNDNNNIINHKYSNVGIFWHNTSETYVDVIHKPGSKDEKFTHWYSESGVIDCFILPGKSINEVYQKYLQLTGLPILHSRSSISYNQCRYSYMSQQDVVDVNKGFEHHQIPYDVIWLDIDHTNGKRYFTWNNKTFPHPEKLIDDLIKKGRKVVTIVDPHIKAEDPNYDLHKKAAGNNFYILHRDGKTNFIGRCWPGFSCYLDFTNNKVKQFWMNQFNEINYPHFKPDHGKMSIWNDMNEPSVFETCERTFPKDLIHQYNITKTTVKPVEHRHIHNIYGHLMVESTYNGLLNNQTTSIKYRPFILTRSFFAGSQRFAAMWTGDNTADWNHLICSIRMLLTISMCGISLCGADIGGFFGNPDYELLIRWYQAAAFQPFFRGHSCTDTKRREPWVFGSTYTPFIRNAIRTRYQFLPYWITLFAMNSGINDDYHHLISPPMRPLCWEFPDFKHTNDEQHETNSWMVGNALLIAPILKPRDEITNHRVVVPKLNNDKKDIVWYDLFHTKYPGISSTRTEQQSGLQSSLSSNTILNYCGDDVTNLDRMFVFQKSGTVIPKVPATQVRNHSQWPVDNQQLIVVAALDNDQCASGFVYVDDGETFACRDTKDFLFCKIIVTDGIIRSIKRAGTPHKVAAYVTSFVLLGVTEEADTDVRIDDLPATIEFSKHAQRLTISGINLKLDGGWCIPFSRK